MVYPILFSLFWKVILTFSASQCETILHGALLQSLSWLTSFWDTVSRGENITAGKVHWLFIRILQHSSYGPLPCSSGMPSFFCFLHNPTPVNRSFHYGHISPTCTIYFPGFVPYQEASCFFERRTRPPCEASSSSAAGQAAIAAQSPLLVAPWFWDSGTPETAFHTWKCGKVGEAFHLKISAGQSLISSKLASLNIIFQFKIATVRR